MSEKDYFKKLEEYDMEVNRLFKENKQLKKNIDEVIELLEETDIHYSWFEIFKKKALKKLKGSEK